MPLHVLMALMSHPNYPILPSVATVLAHVAGSYWEVLCGLRYACVQ